ncbi:MAG: hypothetical protein ACLP07_09420 [Terracidiphilus sp.]
MICTALSPPAACQIMGADTPPELAAVEHGVPGIEAFAQAGGKFTGQKNNAGQTAAMIAAIYGPDVIQAFCKAGGTFTSEKDRSGETAAMYVVEGANYCPGSQACNQLSATIAAFAACGGSFDDAQDNSGLTTAITILEDPDAVPAFIKAGGRFGNQQTSTGFNAGMYAVMDGPASIRAFARSGGKFTSQETTGGETVADMAQSAGGDVLEAFQQSVEEQGGLVFLSSDDEFTATRNPEAIESFVRAGGHFDNEVNDRGLSAAMLAVMRGPKEVEAFAKFGGKFTTQEDRAGETSGDLARMMVGPLAAYNRAVRDQGGLITPKPANEYEAAELGAPGIEAFAAAGGRFTDRPNENDLTSAMIAANKDAAAIAAYSRAGGRFTDWQNKDGYTVALAAAMSGPDAIRAFALAGGHFTDQQDRHGMTAAMWAAARQDDFWPQAKQELGANDFALAQRGGLVNPGGAAIKAFHEAGGSFTDKQNLNGYTAAIFAILNGPEAIRAFAAAGGRFTEQEVRGGFTAEMFAASEGADTITAFHDAGGRFTDHESNAGSSEIEVVQRDTDAVTAFSKAGGVFTDRKDAYGWTSGMIVSNLAEWEWVRLAAQMRAEGQQPNPALRTVLVSKEKARKLAATKAYQEALVRQGGLRHVR